MGDVTVTVHRRETPFFKTPAVWSPGCSSDQPCVVEIEVWGQIARGVPETNARIAGIRFVSGGSIRKIASVGTMPEFRDSHGAFWRTAVVDLEARAERVRILARADPRFQDSATPTIPLGHLLHARVLGLAKKRRSRLMKHPSRLLSRGAAVIASLLLTSLPADAARPPTGRAIDRLPEIRARPSPPPGRRPVPQRAPATAGTARRTGLAQWWNQWNNYWRNF